jgi:molybdate transport system permease protein
MSFDPAPIWLTLKLALTTDVVLLILGTPLAWWLSQTRWRGKPFAEAIIALPLVLPPTVLGFYLLVLLNPQGLIGGYWADFSDSTLTFSFAGLVIASALYSLPFVVQPLQSAFEGIDKEMLEAAATLRASPWDTFFSVVSPLAKRGYITAIVLGFAHTLGEFGVVLMVGGNIPGKTKVLSIAIYEEVELLNFAQAHVLSAGLLAFSFCVLLIVYGLNRHLSVKVN